MRWFARQGFGAMRPREEHAETPGRDPVAAVHVALDAGVRTVGTADAYLNENRSGEPCSGRREEVLLASTFG